jgi:mandelate racemase
VTGRAYAFAYTTVTLHSLAQFVRDIAPELVGKSANPRARMRQMEKRLKLVGWQGFAGMVVGTLDMALWDALARAMESLTSPPALPARDLCSRLPATSMPVT